MSDFDPVNVIIPCWTETADHLADALTSLRPYMRPIVMFNGPGCEAMSKAWFEDESWDDRFSSHKFGFMSDEYIATLGGGCSLCHARNWAADLATSEYIAYLDADDLFLPGIDDVVLAARGRRGAVGGMLVASQDGKIEHHVPQANLTLPPHTGTFVLRRDVVPIFDVWAPHQINYRGPLYNQKWWAEVTDVDLKWVLAEAMTYRWNWSPQQANRRYWNYDGFIGVGAPQRG